MFTNTKLASVIRNQFPEFARDEYPGFINFIELYYKFLDQTETRNIDSYRDLDDTLDTFIELFKKELGLNVQTAGPISDRFFLKHIKDLYSAKGTEESYRILFRHFFNTEIEIKYPQESILRTSDGRWQQDVSVILKQVSGDCNDIVGKHVTINTATGTFDVFVNRVKLHDTQEYVGTLTYYYEVYLAPFYYGNLSVNDIITCEDFVGTVHPTITKINVLKEGSGFNVGQLFTINTNVGSGLKVKVTKVGTNGELRGTQIVRFGAGYDNSFYANIKSIYNSINLTPSVTYNDPYWEAQLNSTSNGFIDYGTISTQTYFLSDYASDASYSGEIVQSFYNDHSTAQGESSANEEYTATLYIQMGAVQKYPGYYSTSNGFLSDAMYLEDNYYYQIYSYVIKVNQSIETYRNIVKSLIHPAGLALFGEYSLANNFDLSASVQMVMKLIALDFQDEAIIDELKTYWMEKLVLDSVDTSEYDTIHMDKLANEVLTSADQNIVDFYKSLVETLNIIENLQAIIQKPLEYYQVIDDGDNAYFAEIYNDEDYSDGVLVGRTYTIEKAVEDNQVIDDLAIVTLTKLLEDTFGLSDSSIADITKRINGVYEQVHVADFIHILGSYGLNLDDESIAEDSLTTLINKILADSFTLSDSSSIIQDKQLADSVSTSESGSIILGDGLFLEDYAASDYAVGNTTLHTF